MKLYFRKISLPVLFEFILFISLVETGFFYFFKLLGLQQFQMIPYLRLMSLLFTFLFFFKNKFYLNNFFKISLKANSENLLVLVWVSFTILGFFVGIVHRNSILYLFTDMVYILFGYFLYRIFYSNQKLLDEITVELTLRQEHYFVISILFFSVIAFVLKIDLPSFTVVFTLVYALYHYNRKNYGLMFLYSLPFFFQILKSNRALLLVFILVLFFAFVQKRFSKKNINDFLLIIAVFLLLCFFFLDDVLKIAISYFPENSTLKDRLVQVYLVLKGNVDWNSPALLSLSQRIDEAKAVIAYWCLNPFNFLFGGGMGATIEGFSFKDIGVADSALLGKTAIHNIHLLPFALIFRYGVIGIGLFLILIYNLFKYLFTIILSEQSLFKTLIVFQFCWMLYSFPAASYLWTCPLFWITLAYVSNEKRINFS
ncbi:MAG: hypothetical protein Q8R22_14345 [Flavobacterium sp.]|uniref:hypothetical protein n=1 Tax=Flavobacterium sp. TaxID=239 RepID=UPI00273232F6|nr:hypothetical protein [Flavobacterium sp.]MDP3682006.1 hypothetical protein [Flavobacterium sp.]MDZ4331018.1 hypothetical protein [Flavobacterium sp.]